MAEVSITSSPVDFEVLSEQWEWAMFRGIDFIADAIQEYFDASNHDINPLSRIGQRHSLWNFYKTLNSVEMKDLDFQLVESFDHLKTTVLKENHRDWDVQRLKLIKAIGILELIKHLNLDVEDELESVKDLVIKTFNISSYQDALNKLFKKAYPSLTSTHPEQKELVAFLKDRKVSKSGVFNLIQQVSKAAFAATKKEIYTFIRKLEVSKFPVPRERPLFFDAAADASAHASVGSTLQPNFTDAQKAAQGPYSSPKQTSSQAAAPKGVLPVVQALSKTVADLKKKSAGKDPLTSILKDASEGEEEAAPQTRTSRSQARAAAKQTNTRKRGRGAVQEEEEEEEEIEEEEEAPKARSPAPVTSPSRTAPAAAPAVSSTKAPAAPSAVAALAGQKYAPAAPKPAGSLIQAGRAGEKVSFGDEEDMDSLPVPRKVQRKRIAWSEDEDNALINGLTKYGPGSWSWIKKDAELNDVLIARSNVDLKDRARNLHKHGRLPTGLYNTD